MLHRYFSSGTSLGLGSNRCTGERKISRLRLDAERRARDGLFKPRCCIQIWTLQSQNRAPTETSQKDLTPLKDRYVKKSTAPGLSLWSPGGRGPRKVRLAVEKLPNDFEH